jgi:hypothetical protein
MPPTLRPENEKTLDGSGVPEIGGREAGGTAGDPRVLGTDPYQHSALFAHRRGER